MDRIKESVFATINNKVKDSIVLDLFAGSGSYGIEAISNNSKFVVFNDKNYECVKVIKESLSEFKVLEKALVLNYDYKRCLEYLQILTDILKYIETHDLLNKDGLVIVEFENIKEDIIYQNLVKIKEKKYGYKNIYIYARKE